MNHVNVETLTTGIALFSSVFAAYFSSFYRIPNVSITINRMGTLAGDMLAGWFYTFVGVWWMIYMFKRLFNCQNSNNNTICIGIDNSLGNPTYTTLTKEEILDKHRSVLCSFGISTKDEELDPPSLDS